MKKVIIAEPVLRVIENSNTLFGRGGIVVSSARTSEEILDLHRTSRVDLIVTDFTLPVMGGARLCSFIRGDAALRGVSLIMVCDGNGPSEDRCRQTGANAVLIKPVDPFELFSRISELLIISQRQAMRTLLHVSVLGRKEKTSFSGVSHNISISGMLLEADEAFERGGRLVCAFTIGGRKLTAECDIVRVEKTASGRFLYGVKFSHLDTKALILIDQFVKGNIKH